MKIKKTIGIITFALGTVSLLAWPILGYSSIFLFDAPLADNLDGNLRYLSVLLVLSYPIGYLAALPLFIIKWRSGTLKIIHSLSGLIPIIHLVVALLITGQIMNYQHDRLNPDIFISEKITIEDRGRDRYVVNQNGDVIVDRDICAQHMIEKENILVVAQKEISIQELGGGTVFEVNSADAPITYFAVNTLDGSVAGGFSIDEIKRMYQLPDDLELFEPEASRNEFIKNNPDLHEINERIREKNISNQGMEPTSANAQSVVPEV